jgi:beta-lactamase class A
VVTGTVTYRRLFTLVIVTRPAVRGAAGRAEAASPAYSCDMSDLSVTLRREIQTLAAAAPGHLSAVVVGADGLTVEVDGGRVVPAASTIKVPILLTVLERVAEGTSRLQEPVHIGEDRVGGGALSLVPSVTELPLVEALRLMIALSDNDATNAVIALVGLEAVGRTCRRLGLAHTQLRRRLMNHAARDAGLDNVTCARDLARVMTALWLGEALPQAETRLALDLLAEQQFLDGLPALLPERVWHANKTGELSGVRHDMALVEHGGRWAAVAVTATSLAGSDDGEDRVDRGATVLPTFASIGAAVGNWVIGTGRTDALPDPHRP